MTAAAARLLLRQKIHELGSVKALAADLGCAEHGVQIEVV